MSGFRVPPYPPYYYCRFFFFPFHLLYSPSPGRNSDPGSQQALSPTPPPVRFVPSLCLSREAFYAGSSVIELCHHRLTRIRKESHVRTWNMQNLLFIHSSSSCCLSTAPRLPSAHGIHVSFFFSFRFSHTYTHTSRLRARAQYIGTWIRWDSASPSPRPPRTPPAFDWTRRLFFNRGPNPVCTGEFDGASYQCGFRDVNKPSIYAKMNKYSDLHIDIRGDINQIITLFRTK